MKKYIEPKIKVSMFSVETIATTEDPVVLQSLPYGDGITNYMEQYKNQQRVKKQYDFNNAIKFN